MLGLYQLRYRPHRANFAMHSARNGPVKGRSTPERKRSIDQGSNDNVIRGAGELAIAFPPKIRSNSEISENLSVARASTLSPMSLPR